MNSRPEQPHRRPLGGIVHVYRGYDPIRFPPPTTPPEGMAREAMGEHMLSFGSRRAFTDEELAEAIQLPPEAIAGLGPSIDSLIEILERRRERILETWNPSTAARIADGDTADRINSMQPPEEHAERFRKEAAGRQIRGLENLWYLLDPESRFAVEVVQLVDMLATLDRVEGLRDEWPFRGRRPMTIEEALQVREELEEIERLLEQLREARKNAKLAIIDMDALREFVSEAEVEGLEGLREKAEEMMRQIAEQEGLEQGPDGWKMGARAMRSFQSSLLATVFSDLQGGRTGRHDPVERSDGVNELPGTRPWEFGDAFGSIDVTSSVLNALRREVAEGTVHGSPRLQAEDLEVHRTRSTTKCATVVIMDMSGSMRWGGQYVACKRMALALEALVRSEYPGDRLHFIEMFSVARPVPRGDLIELLPKPVTIRDPVVRLKADMSDPDIGEYDLPPHFTNIQHALQLARRLLAGVDTPNRQVMLITDGLPTAHFEGSDLFLLYPPDPRTEAATMREARQLSNEGSVLNVMLIPGWSQNQEDVQFAQRLAETTRGRVVFTAGSDLDRFVVWDYLARRRRMLG